MKTFTFPSPDDRSLNSPIVLLDPEVVTGLYRQYNPGQDSQPPRKGNDIVVMRWMATEATKRGWSNVQFFGCQCLLSILPPKVRSNHAPGTLMEKGDRVF